MELEWMLLISLCVSHVVLGKVFKNFFPGKGKKGEDASEWVAFNSLATVAIAYMAYLGTVGWLGGAAGAISADGDARLLSDSKDAAHLAKVMLGYQLYNVMVAFYVGGDLAAPAMIGHHFFTATLGALGCGTYKAPFCHYYCFFFFGLAELTNIPLAVVDFFKFFPKMRDRYTTCNTLARVLFAGGFMVVRVVYWPIVSLQFWRDCFALIQRGGLDTMTLVTILCFLGGNIFLTGLQFMWGAQIGKFIKSTLFPNPDKKA